MISKDTGAILKDNSSGVVLKDNSSTTSNGGATWAYEVAGQTMVCPIIVEDLAPPGQMLVEVWFRSGLLFSYSPVQKWSSFFFFSSAENEKFLIAV
jgi:hypothetical protein